MAIVRYKNSNGEVKTLKAIKVKNKSTDWQPQADWWDIDTILENDTEDYPAKIICLLSDSDVASNIRRLGATKIKTSDGAEYTDTTQNSFLHTWNIELDKKCHLGYKTRYIIYYYSSQNINFTNDFGYKTALYCIIKSALFSISGKQAYGDSSCLECLKMIDCTQKGDWVNFADMYSLKNIIGFNNLNVSRVIYLFQNCNILEKTMQEIIHSLDWSKITTANSAFRANRTITYFPRVNTSNITDANLMFNQAMALKVIENLDLISLKSCSGMFSQTMNLVSINNISNIRISGLDFSSCILLNHDTLIRILNALHDHSTDTENVHTIIFGATNLTKLTDEEMAIGQNKGWTIS